MATAAHPGAAGNSYFSEGRYEQAILSYSEAMVTGSSQDATLYTNRALCQLKLGRHQEAVEDCHQALNLDSALVKGHFFMGQALIELGRLDEAIVSLKKANELAKQQRKNFGESITSAIRYAKKLRWRNMEEKRLQQGSEFQTFLEDMLKESMRHQLSELEQEASADGQSRVQAVQQEHEKRCRQLQELFQEADEKRKFRDVPDYMCGKISFELLSDPVITPSGITYERKDIEDHLQRVGHFDPVTRLELTEDQLIPNLAMKEVVDSFREANQWVEDY